MTVAHIWIVYNSRGSFLRAFQIRIAAQRYIDNHPYGDEFQLAMVLVYE